MIAPQIATDAAAGAGRAVNGDRQRRKIPAALRPLPFELLGGSGAHARLVLALPDAARMRLHRVPQPVGRVDRQAAMFDADAMPCRCIDARRGDQPIIIRPRPPQPSVDIIDHLSALGLAQQVLLVSHWPALRTNAGCGPTQRATNTEPAQTQISVNRNVARADRRQR
ncbi:hypothetical protein [Sphingopyxis macrogoltabida]|uniref:hypothetical protein n=1 Tax=Sphingopyxis macrogoltabida TaxID=33050 RepID=UPI0011AB7405|nr:hypothetical protein [Sphingopyxis macrogoltabida]